MTPQRPSLLTLENSLYLAFFGLALFLRLYQLGAFPLNDEEAREALAVLRLLRSQPEIGLPHSPVYFFFTYFHFLILQPSDFTARLAPALVGSLLVLLPWLFRDWLGRAPALITAALLSVSTSLIAASRSADGSIMALFALVLSLGLLRRYLAGGPGAWLIGSAVALGVGVAGGAPFVTGLLVLALTWLVASRSMPGEALRLEAIRSRLNAERLSALVALALSLGLVATVGMIYRAGLSALAQSWLNWLLGFALTADGRPLFTLPTFLLVYEPLTLIFGAFGAVQAFRRGQPRLQAVAVFAMIALLFSLFYSGRSLLDTIWIVAPLAVLAANALTDLVAKRAARDLWPLAGILSAILFALFAFALINLTRVNTFTFQGSNLAGAGLAATALLVAVLVTALFGAGWSPQAAGLGGTLGAASVLLALQVSAGWGLAQVRATQPLDLWWPRPTASDVNRLVATLKDVSNFNVGQENEIEVIVQAGPESALAWALRDFPKASFVDSLGAFITSPVVIAPETEQSPALGEAYLGQGFALYNVWRPENLFWNEQLDWLAFRRAPIESANVVLWVRSDVQELETAQQP